MKKIIVAVIITFFSAFAAAGSPICDSKRTQREFDECYQYSINGGLLRMKKNYDRIIAASKVPQKEKDYIPGSHKSWSDEVSQKCGNNNQCFYDNISKRNGEIETYMRGHGLNPV